MSHPCDGHECDHCWICDTLGICCLCVPNVKAVLSSDDVDSQDSAPISPASFGKTRIEELREAIAADSAHLSMIDLVRLDVEFRLSTNAPSDGPLFVPQLDFSLSFKTPVGMLPPGQQLPVKTNVAKEKISVRKDGIDERLS